MIIDKHEAKRLLGSISQEELHEAMQNPLTHCAPGQEDNFQTATSYVAGKITARLEALELENRAELPTVEEINMKGLEDADALKKQIGEMTSEELSDFLNNLCWRSYRYGYYQGRSDLQDYAPNN